MSVIIDELNNKFDGKYNFLRVNKVDVDTCQGRADVIYLYPYEKEGEFTDKDREVIRNWTLYMMPKKLKYNVVFKKSYIDEEVLLRKVKEYFREYQRSIAGQLGEDDIKVTLDDIMHVKIDIGPRFYDYLVSQANIEVTLKSYLEHNFTKDAEIVVTKKDKDNEFVFDNADKVVEYHRREISIREKEMGNIVGKGISGNAMYIADIKAPMTDIIIAGKIEQFSRKIAKSGYIYYTFVVDDTTGKVSCKYFTRKKDKGLLDGITDGMEVAIEGLAEDDQYIKAVSVLVRKMSFATIDYDSISLEADMNIIYDKYMTVEPEKYIDIKQENMFALGEEDEVPAFMQGRDFVVFDFETTGLNEKEDKPIEIGALRIHDGKMTESFSSLVNPGIPIPEVVQGITHIDDEMVKGAPAWKDVLPDFYKFTRGAALVGHNVMFDFNILTSNSKDLGYSFDNELIDTCKLAMQYMRGQANNKLITLCNFLGISLEGAHRALNDVVATAELFKSLAKNYLSK